MPSDKFTKININRDTLEMLQTLAAAKGISATTLLEHIILFYLKHGQKAVKE